MRLEAVLTDALSARLLPRPEGRLRVALLVPQQGALGMLSPSVTDAALLAAHDVNLAGGVRGALVDLVLVDGGRTPGAVAAEVAALTYDDAIDAVVSSCASDVHRAVAQAVAGRIPCVYTPPHEGAGRPGAVVRLGPSPAQQLSGAIGWLTAAHGLRRWALIGSDYVWPWATHRAARRIIAAAGARTVLDTFVTLRAPDGGPDHAVVDRVIDQLDRQRADGVLVSLVGAEQVTLHRALHESGLDRRLVRLSGALEENGLLAAGGDRTGLLYASMPSFTSVADEAHRSLIERHAAVLGPHAPVLDSYAAAAYDGVSLVSRLAADDGLRPDVFARSAGRLSRLHQRTPHLARADGLDLAVVARMG